MSGRTKATVLVLICVALWALIPVVAKLGQTHLDNHQFLFWSSLVSTLVLFGGTGVTGNLPGMRKYRAKDWAYLVFLGLLGTYIYYLFLYFGYAHARGMEVLVVQYSWPILIVVFSFFLLRERLTATKVASVVLGFFGVFTVLTKGDYGGIDLGNFWVIGLVASGAACFALFSVLSKNVKHEPLGVTSLYFLSACVASLLSMLYYSKFAFPSRSEILPILLNGILVNGFSYVFWLTALKNTEASYLAPFTFITPVLSAVYLIVFFGEPFVWAYGMGLLCVVGGGLINSLSARRRTPIET